MNGRVYESKDWPGRVCWAIPVQGYQGMGRVEVKVQTAH